MVHFRFWIVDCGLLGGMVIISLRSLEFWILDFGLQGELAPI
jgi:hypothetical protein